MAKKLFRKKKQAPSPNPHLDEARDTQRLNEFDKAG
jgi:hypothetical protein